MFPVFSGVRVTLLLLLLCVYDLSYFMFFVVFDCFPCLVFVPGLHRFDYRYNLGFLDYSLNRRYLKLATNSNKSIQCFKGNIRLHKQTLEKKFLNINLNIGPLFVTMYEQNLSEKKNNRN